MARAARSPSLSSDLAKTVGISAIATYEPPGVLENEWFNGSIPRKFIQHTGIRSRHIAWEDEVAMGMRAMEALRREVDFDLGDCAALIFASPSLVPASVGRKFLSESRADEEIPNYVAKRFADRLGVSNGCVLGINWFCSGYTKALSLAQNHLLPRLDLGREQFMLVVTVSRISRITDYGCPRTAPLFGDMATVTVLARADSRKYPVHFTLLGATAETHPIDSVLFDFDCRENVLTPTRDGGSSHDPRRVVFSLNGMGIGDAAPRAMAQAAANVLQATGVRPEEVTFVVPHQAGSGIVRLAAMKLEEVGLHGQVINGLTSDVGNVSACSIPYALRKEWGTLHGTIAAPSAGVGPPGEAKVSQGCILLRTTQFHNHCGCGA
jgi:3-oxoacyl-[acyl-carrier-protein] synthase III